MRKPISLFCLFFSLVGPWGALAANDDAHPQNESSCPKHLLSFSPTNRTFYNRAENWLEGLAERKGISRGEDLEAIRAIIEIILRSPSSRVLEIGPGRGRVIRWILENFPSAEIIAVDQSERTAERLSDEFKTYPNVTILNSDILDLDLPQPVLLALWMWSGFAEISKEEKPKALQRVFQNLASDGLFVIDMPREIVGKETIVHGNGGVVELQESFATLMAHLVTEDELKALAQNAGFTFLRTLNYQTSTGIPRTAFVFEKP